MKMLKCIHLFAGMLFASSVLAAEPVAVWSGDFNVTEKDGYTLNLNNHTVAADGSHVLIGVGTNGIEINWDTGIGAATVIFKCEDIPTEVVAGKNSCYATVYNTQSLNRVGVIRRPADGKLQGVWANTPWGASPTPDFPTSTGSQVYALGYQYNSGTIFCSNVNDTWTTLLDEGGLGSPAYDNNSIKGFSILGYRGSSSNMITLDGAKVTAVAVFDKKLTAEEIAAYKFPTSGTKPVLFNFFENAAAIEGWINHRQSGGSNITTETSEGIQFTATGKGNFFNQGEPTVDFGEGEYTDINGKSHTTITEEVKASLGLPATTPFDTSVYFTGLMNGGVSGHTATISGLDSGAKYVIYAGFGRNKENGGQKAGFTIAESGYGSVDALEYVVSQEGNNTSVVPSYQTFTAGSGLTAGGLGVLIVRLNGVTPTDEGKVVFTLSGDRAGINFLAIKEIQGGSTPEATIKLEAVKVSDINNAPELAKCSEDDTVIVNLVGTKTLTFDTELKFGKAKVYLDGVLTLLSNESSAPDPYEISKFNFNGVSAIDYSWIEIGSGMAINFHSSGRSLGDREEAGIPGLTIYGNCWNNDDSATGKLTAKMFAPNGSDIIGDTMSINWSCANVYQWDDASVTTPYLKGYLDDGSLTISATVPFGCYDVYIICATDTANAKFSYKTINGVKYSADINGEAIANSTAAWGQSHQTTPVLGKNVMHVSNLTTHTFNITESLKVSGTERGCVAAIVIVKVTPAKVVDVECGDGKSMSEINAIDADIVNLHFNDGGVLTVDVAPNKPCHIIDEGAFTLDDANGVLDDGTWGKFDFAKATGEVTIKVNVSDGVTSSALPNLIFAANDNTTFVFNSTNDSSGMTLNFGQPVETIKCHIVFDGGTHAMTYLNQNKNCLFGLNGTGDKPTVLVAGGATLNFTAKDLSWYSGAVDINGVIRVNDGATLNFIQSENATFFYRQRLWLDPGSLTTFDYIAKDQGAGPESCFRWQGGITNGVEQIYVPASETDMRDKPAIIKQLGAGDLHLASDQARGLAFFVGENSKLQLDTEFSTGAADAVAIKTGGGILEFKRDVTAQITVYDGGVGFASDCNVKNLIFESDNTLIEVAEGLTVSPNITRNGHSIIKLGEGALKLDAGYEGELTIKEGVLKLQLSPTQVAAGYTASGVTFGEGITGITFVLPDGTEVPTEGNAYEGGGLQWTGAAGDNRWKTPGNWSTGTVPTADDAVAIGYEVEIIVESTDTCKMLAIQNAVSLVGSFDSLGITSIDPEKTLTVTVGEGEEKTFPSVTGGGNFVKAGDGTLVVANAPEGPIEIAGGKLVAMVNTPATMSAVISGEGCFEKRGQAALTLTAENTLTGGLIVGDGVLKMGASKCLGPYYTEDADYATIIVKEGATLDTNGQTNGGSQARTYSVQFEAKAILTDTGTRTNDLKFFPLCKIVALGDMFIDVDEGRNVGISLHYNSDGVELDLGENTVTKRGEGEFVLGSGAPIIGTGKLLIQAGTLTTQPRGGGATSVAEEGTVEFAEGTIFNPTTYSSANGDITAATIIFDGMSEDVGTLTATKKLAGKGVANNIVVGDGATIDATGEGAMLVSTVTFGSSLTVISETDADIFMVGIKPTLPITLTVLSPDENPNRGSFELQYEDSTVKLVCTVLAFELPIIENASFTVEGGEIVDEHYARVAMGGNATISYTTTVGYSFYDSEDVYTGKSLIEIALESLQQDPKITDLLKDVTTRQAVVSLRDGNEVKYYFDFMEAFNLLQANEELILYANAILTLTDYTVLANTAITLNGFTLSGGEAVSFLIDSGVAFYLYNQGDHLFDPDNQGMVEDITFKLLDGILYSYAPLSIDSNGEPYVKVESDKYGYTYVSANRVSALVDELKKKQPFDLPESKAWLIEAVKSMGYEMVSTMSVEKPSEYRLVISPDEAVNGSWIASFEIADGSATIKIPNAKANFYYGLEYADNPAFENSVKEWAEKGAKALSAEAKGANMFYRVLITDKDPTIK